MALHQNAAMLIRTLISSALPILSSHSYYHLTGQNIPVSPAQHSPAIASKLLQRKPVEAYHLFDQLLKSNPNPDFDHRICSSLLAALSSEGHLKFSQIVFDTMLCRNINLSTIGFGVFVSWFCRSAELHKTLCLLDGVGDRIKEINGSVVAVMVVDGLCRVSKVMDAQRVLDELRRRECKPDFMAYQVVVEAFRRVGCMEEARQVLKQKRKLGVAPRINDYKEFIFDLISERLFQEAKDLGEVIIKGDFPIDDDVLNALIEAVSGLHADAALSFCKHMIGKDRFPSLPTFSSLSRNLIKNGKIDKMWDIFHILSSKDYFSDLQSYNTMVSILCEGGNVKEAYGVLKEMRKKGFGPNIFTYNCLLEACCREDLLRPAKRLWDEMFANGCHGNLQTYNTLIVKLSKFNEIEEALRLFHHMLERGLLPDNVTYTSLIRGMCQEAKIDEAYEIFLKSKEQDNVLAELTLRTLIISLCKEGNFISATKFLQYVPSTDVQNSKSHVILLKCLADAGEIKMAINHIRWLRDSNGLKLRTVLNELVQSLSFSLKMEPTLRLLHAVREMGVVLEDESWINMTREIQEVMKGETCCRN